MERCSSTTTAGSRARSPRQTTVATIFAWSGALNKRGELDNNHELSAFAERLEAACTGAINDGIMTNDLARLCSGGDVRSVDTAAYIKEVRRRMIG